jgi:hypothetical protein
MVRQYFKNLGAAVSQLVNAVFGGDPDETLSSRVGKRMEANRMPLWARLVAWVTGRDHLRQAIERDEGKDRIRD